MKKLLLTILLLGIIIPAIACSGTTARVQPSGTIHSGAYSNGAECFWFIQPSGATYITLNFISFDTEIAYDYVRVYDGDNLGAPLLGTFSGTELPESVTSTGGTMIVSFVSYANVPGTGWTANYNSDGDGIQTNCYGLTNLTSSSGAFSDETGTNDYVNYSNCGWLIEPENAESVTLTFSDFDIEEDYDYVRIYDGTGSGVQLLASYTGTFSPDPVTSTTGVMYVTFLTDESSTQSGWSATYNSEVSSIATIDHINAASVYPNPSSEYLTLEMEIKEATDIAIEIANVSGQQIYASAEPKSLGSFQKTIQLNNIESGLYLLKVTTNKGEIRKKVFVMR